jgi:hypothetical protein
VSIDVPVQPGIAQELRAKGAERMAAYPKVFLPSELLQHKSKTVNNFSFRMILGTCKTMILNMHAQQNVHPMHTRGGGFMTTIRQVLATTML